MFCFQKSSWRDRATCTPKNTHEPITGTPATHVIGGTDEEWSPEGGHYILHFIVYMQKNCWSLGMEKCSVGFHNIQEYQQ